MPVNPSTTEIKDDAIDPSMVQYCGPARGGATGGVELLRRLAEQRDLIAMDLHDGMLQEVTGARMELESLLSGEKIPKGPVRDSLVRILDLLRRAAAEGRRVVLGLRPAVLETEGLSTAIARLTADQPQGGPKVEFRSTVPSIRLDPYAEDMVYRIVEEAVTNLRRHSQSERAEVLVRCLADRLEIVVQDWGVGFDPARVADKRLGLKGIRERARLLGGRVQVDAAPGKGTRIVVDLPLVALPLETSVTNDRSLS